MKAPADPLAGAVSRFTLRFRDPALEKRFAEAQALKLLRPVRLGMAVAVGMLVLMWLAHEFLTPAERRVIADMTRVVLLGSVTIALVVAATYTRTVQRHAQLSMVVLATLMSFGLIAISFRQPREMLVTRGYLMLMLHEFTIYTLMLRFPGGVVAGWLALGMYLAFAWASGLFETVDMMRSAFWLVMANVWGMALCYQIDQRVRREFLALELLAAERERSERLLLNVLPAPVAERLKRSGDAIADYAENVTVLFADIVGFTVLAARKSPQEIVALLDRVFTRFDALADQHGLEKIKTIGDAYMAVAGLPDACDDHAHRAARMALEMLDCVRAIAAEIGEPLQVRIGLNSGPVVAGVIGQRKFIYDMWGDTVNTASRMESHGEPGAIQCTQATALLLEGFALQPRGSIAVKGKGEMVTYAVEPQRVARTEAAVAMP